MYNNDKFTQKKIIQMLGAKSLFKESKETSPRKAKMHHTIKGKFLADQPQKSTYANPEYKKGNFEEYYRERKAQDSKCSMRKSDTRESLSQQFKILK